MQQDGFAQTVQDPELSAQKSENQAGSDAGARAKAMIGRVLKGQYRIHSVLGQGAMGLVFRGTQSGLEKAVAIKIMSPDGFHTDESRDRFRREATVVSKLLHPSITQVLDFGIEGDLPFLVMEFVDGKELTDVLAQEGPMPPTRALAIVRQLASALEEAHRHGVVHRDIKPQNLRLMRYTPGGQVFLKVLDFGIAKQLGEGSGQGHMTATGAVMGTPMYMAPEQAGGHKVDARADQYAVGIVLYELLTGTVPFTGETLTGVLVSHLTKPPPPLPRQVPEPLQKVVMKLLAKSPADRFADMAELDRALAACEPACRDVVALQLGRVQAFVAGGEIPAKSPPPSRSLLPVAGAAAVAVMLLIVVAVLGPHLRARKAARDQIQPTPIGVSLTPPVVAVGSPPGPSNPTGNPTSGTTAGATTGPTAGPTTGLTAVPTAGPTTVPTTGPTSSTLAGSPTGVPTPGPIPGGKPGHRPTKPHSETSGNPAPSTPEPEEVKAKLNEAQRLLDNGDGMAAIEQAKRSLSDGKFARAYRIMTLASCKSGNIGMAKTYFHNVAAADRNKVAKTCAAEGKDLANE